MKQKNELVKMGEGQPINLWLRKDLGGINTLQIGWQEKIVNGVIAWDFNFGENGVVGISREVEVQRQKSVENLVFDVIGTDLKVKLDYTNTNPNLKLSLNTLIMFKQQLEGRKVEFVKLGVSDNPIKAMLIKLNKMIEARSLKADVLPDQWQESGIPKLSDIYSD